MSRRSKSKCPRTSSSGLIADVLVAGGTGAEEAACPAGRDAADRKLGKDLTLSKGDKNGAGAIPWKDSRGAEAPRTVSAISKGDTAMPLDVPQRSV